MEEGYAYPAESFLKQLFIRRSWMKFRALHIFAHEPEEI